MAWAGRIAAAAATPDDVVVCSTDDQEIAAAASTWGIRVLARPDALATDTATSLEVALHALDALAGDGEPIDLLVARPADVAADRPGRSARRDRPRPRDRPVRRERHGEPSGSVASRPGG